MVLFLLHFQEIFFNSSSLICSARNQKICLRAGSLFICCDQQVSFQSKDSGINGMNENNYQGLGFEANKLCV